MKISASIVFYNTPVEIARRILDCVSTSSVKIETICIDNSPTDILSTVCEMHNTKYIHLADNPGFGIAHNKAISTINSEVHFILNPDIEFNIDTIKILATRLLNDSSLSAITPKVVYPDKNVQHLCKILPTPANLIARRFMPWIATKLDYNYEMRWFDYQSEIYLLCASGCFVGIKTDILKAHSGFDPRYFMYMEDIDLTRRIYQSGHILFYPEVEVTHDFAKSSYKNTRILFIHIFSAIKYFNKWGWFIDSERKRLNCQMLKKSK